MSKPLYRVIVKGAHDLTAEYLCEPHELEMAQEDFLTEKAAEGLELVAFSTDASASTRYIFLDHTARPAPPPATTPEPPPAPPPPALSAPVVTTQEQKPDVK